MKVNRRARIIQTTCGVVTIPLLGETRILVKDGQEIEVGVIIAKTESSRQRCELNLAEKLGVSGEQTASFIVRRVGDEVVKGETVAVKKSFFRERKVVSPIRGLVSAFSPQTGSLIIESCPESANVASPISGKICQIEKEKSIGVETYFSGILGVVGLGSFSLGKLKITKTIDQSCRDCIAIVPGHIGADVLYKALGMGVSGVIAGSTHLSDFAAFEQKLQTSSEQGKFSLLITEGFGLTEMGRDIIDHLAQFESRMVILTGDDKKLIIPSLQSTLRSSASDFLNFHSLREKTQDSSRKGKVLAREVFENQADSPRAKGDEMQKLGEKLPSCDSLATAELKIGNKVRLVENKNFGKIGEVLLIDNQPTLLPSKLKATLVEVDLGDQKVSIPSENIEVIL